MTDFLNPYNFVPAPPRRRDDPDLGDHAPEGHHRLAPERWTGRIGVKMTVETPLLVPDTSAVRFEIHNGKRHPVFPNRLDDNGDPVIAPESIKGMLRAAYEAVTNSRFGVFTGHDAPLAYRAQAHDGLAMVPARVMAAGPTAGTIRLLMGRNPERPRLDGARPRVPSPARPKDSRAPGLMYAAWLPRYAPKTPLHYHGTTPPDLPAHGDEVWCIIEERNHRAPSFDYDEVVAIGRSGTLAPPLARGQILVTHGWVCVTGDNMNGKHHERVFFSQGPTTARDYVLADEMWKKVRQRWRDIVTNYQETHRDELEDGISRPPPLRRGRVWSRHVGVAAATGVSAVIPVAERELTIGTLVYVPMDFDSGNFDVGALAPVIIPRRLFLHSPNELLPGSLKPAAGLGEFSAADRVFGWVNGRGHGAYRGHLRVKRVLLSARPPGHGAQSVRGFQPPLRLAIMGAPKPAQYRFYVSGDRTATQAYDPQHGAEIAFTRLQNLRGRKVYLHHRQLGNEHDRVDNVADNQNRSIRAWVRPQTKFTFELDVSNLSSVELGALLWLLDLPQGCFHRFGGGKPLGFGSVRLEMDPARTTLSQSADHAKRWSLDPTFSWSDEPTYRATIATFQDAVARAYGAPFPKVSFIEAFVAAGTGYPDVPVHYPRLGDEAGNEYEWFRRNPTTALPTLGPNAPKLSRP